MGFTDFENECCWRCLRSLSDPDVIQEGIAIYKVEDGHAVFTVYVCGGCHEEIQGLKKAVLKGFSL